MCVQSWHVQVRDLAQNIATEEQISQQDKRDLINALVAAPKKNRLTMLESSTAEEADGSNALPFALWKRIFDLLPVGDLHSIALVCSRFNAVYTEIRRAIEVSQLSYLTVVYSLCDREERQLVETFKAHCTLARLAVRFKTIDNYDEVCRWAEPMHCYQPWVRIDDRAGTG
jgi:hypothetical protein